VSPARRLAVLRVTLALVAVADLLSYYGFIAEARADALINGIAPSGLVDLVSRPPVAALLVLMGVAALLHFARRPGRLWFAVIGLATLAILGTVHGRLYGSPWRHLFFSGVGLTGWILGLAASRRRGASEDESYAAVGTLALLGAAYFNSAISKFVYGGPGWMTGHPIQVIVVGQDGLVSDGLLSGYRTWVASTPAVAAAFSLATLLFEGAGPLMLIGPKLRRLIAAGLIAMHANIYLVTDIVYWESVVLLAAFGLFGAAPGARAPAVSYRPVIPSGGRFVAAAVVLALCAGLAIRHQAQRYASARSVVAAPPPAAAAQIPPTVLPRRIGPFTVGQTLAETWAVESVRLSDTGLVVGVAGPQGRAGFELTCADTEHRSPFDFDGAHLFYSSQLELGTLTAAARAVRARIDAASEGRAVCEQLAQWRRGAAASDDAPPGAQDER
jgi:hypothetical protein